MTESTPKFSLDAGMLGLGLAIGISIGAGLGSVMEILGVGLFIGLLIGIAIGILLSVGKRWRQKHKPRTRPISPDKKEN